jgi:hypothetical protein
MLFAVSDVVWNAVIGAIMTIVVAWMQMRTKLSVDKGNDDNAKVAGVQAKKTEEVKVALATNTADTNKRLDDQGKTLVTVHTLVNNDMHKALATIADLARWKANQTQVPEDAHAADAAELNLKAHDFKQDTVDKASEAKVDPPVPMH